MVKRIRQKLRGAAGASVVMALGIMMAMAALCASMLSIAVTAPRVAIQQQQEQQAYLTVTSAARLLQDILDHDPIQLASLLDGTVTSCVISLQKDSSTFVEATVTVRNIDSVSGEMTVDISAQGYSLTGVQLTFTPTP